MAAVAGTRRSPVTGGRPREVRVKLTEDEYAALALRAQAERVTIASLLVQTVLTPQNRAIRALVFELLSFRTLLQSLTNSLHLLAIDGETEGYDVDAHDLASHEVQVAIARINAALERVAEDA
jgi:hypothetical protein